MMMHVKNMYVLIYRGFAVSYQHDSTLNVEIADNTKRGIFTRESSARYWIHSGGEWVQFCSPTD